MLDQLALSGIAYATDGIDSNSLASTGVRSTLAEDLPVNVLSSMSMSLAQINRESVTAVFVFWVYGTD